jgi:hypothetical protein
MISYRYRQRPPPCTVVVVSTPYPRIRIAGSAGRSGLQRACLTSDIKPGVGSLPNKPLFTNLRIDITTLVLGIA